MSFGGVNTFQQYSTDFGLGHNGVRISFSYFDGFPEPSLLNSLASNDLKLVFKSLLKRDETTKEKALNDLVKLVERCSENKKLFESDIFFLCWTQVYPKLLVSESKAIRVSSHLVTSKLVKLLNKKISKFLKDVMPLLLLGSCDPDSSVSKTCGTFINEIFDFNKSKVDVLWSVFQEDILKVADELIVKENKETISDERFVGKEDSHLRFNRLMTSAVQLLNKLVASRSSDLEKNEELLHNILSSEEIWQLLSFKDLHSLRSYEAALVLQKTLCKDGYLRKRRDVLKVCTKRLLESLSQVNSKNILKVSHLTGPVLDNLRALDCLRKDGKIWTYDKSAKKRLLHFISIASKNAHPGFFDSLYKLYEETSSHKLLDEQSEWLPLWRGSNASFIDKPYLGRFGPELLGELWTNYRKFISSSAISGAKKVAQEDALAVLRSGKRLSELPSLKLALVDFLDSELLETEIKKALVENGKEARVLLDNLALLLCEGQGNETALHSIAGVMLDMMSTNQDGFGTKEQNILETYAYFIKENVSFLSNEITRFVFEVPTWLDNETYESLSLFIADYSQSLIAQNDSDFVKVMEDFLIAATSIDIPKKLIIRTLNLLSKEISKRVLSSTEIQGFVQNYTDTYCYNDEGELFKGCLVNERNIVQLYERSSKNGHADSFVNHLSDLNQTTLKYLMAESSFLSHQLFDRNSEATNRIYGLIKPLLANNDAITRNLSSAIVSYAKTRPRGAANGSLLEIAEELVTLAGQDIHVLLPSNLEREFSEAVSFVDHRLALVSSLKLNTHLLDLSQDELDLSKVEQLIKYGIFLDTLVRRLSAGLDDELCIFLTMICELAEDFNCLSEIPQEEFSNIRHGLLSEKWSAFSFEDAIDVACSNDSNGEAPHSLLSQLVADSPLTAVTYYRLRIFHKILQNKIDSTSQTTFARKYPVIEKFVTSTIRVKEKSQHRYLVAGIILSASETFSNTDLFAKLRNVLASECIGVKEGELLHKTYKNIILLSNLLGSRESVESPSPIATQRLNMMLSSLSQWLESDLAYEPEFSKIRLALLILCAHLVRMAFVMEVPNTSLSELSIKLLNDSLAMCLLDDTQHLHELRLYSLLLHEELLKGNRDYSTGMDSEEMLSGLIELSLVDFAGEKNNQVSSVFYRTLYRVLANYPAKQTVRFYPEFLSSFLSSEKCHNINRARMLFGELRRLTVERQKDAFLEFEFEKQKNRKATPDGQADEAIGDEPVVNDKLQLPPQLIDKLCADIPEDYLENENKCAFLKYLWYWDLAFCFFSDASYDLRQKFIEQLRGRDLVTLLFDFISEQIDMQETKFWSAAGSEAILEYCVQDNDFSPYDEDLYPECKKLLGHSLYNLFLHVGSLTSSWWLNIKDRTLQTKIDKFVSTFISPILIAKELDDVAEKTKKLESNDSALTIKINKVTNEVKASYLIDEQKLELSFKLPTNYPLTNVQVIGVSRVGISEQKWKQWIMSTQRVITGMNGSVVDSLDLFSNNVNLQFSGFEECAICYSILHVVDRKLPTKTCPTCNNKFHGACLYKWFRSSGNNTCPLCRSEIPFRR